MIWVQSFPLPPVNRREILRYAGVQEETPELTALLEELDIDAASKNALVALISEKNSGRLQTFIIRGEKGDICRRINSADPVFMELLPLTLEEVFISETEVVGYDFADLGL